MEEIPARSSTGHAMGLAPQWPAIPEAAPANPGWTAGLLGDNPGLPFRSKPDIVSAKAAQTPEQKTKGGAGMLEQLLQEICAGGSQQQARDRFNLSAKLLLTPLAWAFWRFTWPDRRPKFVADAVATVGATRATGYTQLLQAILALDSKLIAAEKLDQKVLLKDIKSATKFAADAFANISVEQAAECTHLQQAILALDSKLIAAEALEGNLLKNVLSVRNDIKNAAKFVADAVADAVANIGVEQAAGYIQLQKAILALDLKLIDAEAFKGNLLKYMRTVRNDIENAAIRSEPNVDPTEEQARSLVSSAIDLIALGSAVYASLKDKFPALVVKVTYRGNDLLADDEWRAEFVRTLWRVSAGMDFLRDCELKPPQIPGIFSKIVDRDADALQLFASLVDKIHEKQVGRCGALRDEYRHVLGHWSIALYWCTMLKAENLTGPKQVLDKIRNDAVDYKPGSRPQFTRVLTSVRALPAPDSDVRQVLMAVNSLMADPQSRGLTALALTSTVAAIKHKDYEPKLDTKYAAKMRDRLIKWIDIGSIGQHRLLSNRTQLGKYLQHWIDGSDFPEPLPKGWKGSVLDNGPPTRKLGIRFEEFVDAVCGKQGLSDNAKKLVRALTTVVIRPPRKNAAEGHRTNLARFSDDPPIPIQWLEVAIITLARQDDQCWAAQVISPVLNRKPGDANGELAWATDDSEPEAPSAFYACPVSVND